MSQITYTTTATATYATGNKVQIASSNNMFSGLPIAFSGNVFGGITAGTTYYIGNIVVGYPSSTITLTTTPGGGIYSVANATGSMTATFSQGGQQIIPTVAPGEPLNQAFNAVNVNFDQIFAAGPVGTNVQIDNNTIQTLNTNGNLILNPNGVGVVIANAHVLPDQTRIRNLGSPSRKWLNIYAQYLTVDNASLGNINNLTIDVANLHVLGGSNGYVLQTDGTGNLTWTAQTGGSGNGTPGGANTQVQYNDGGAFGGTAGFTFDKTSNALSAVKINTTDVFNSNGIVLENSDLTHGATAAVVIPTNGSSDPIQVNNTYGNIALRTGAGSGITASWSFNNDGSLSLPGGDLAGLGNVIGPGNISYPFGPGPVLLANTVGNNSAYFSLTAVANADGVLGYVGMANFGGNSTTGLIETVDGTGNSYNWYFQNDGTTAFPSYTFPNVDGTSGQVFSTYGNGLIYWANAATPYANTVGSFGSDMGIGPNYAGNDPAILFGEDDVLIRTGGTANTGGQNYGELYLAGSEDAYFGQADNLVDSTYPTFNTSVFANATSIAINTPGNSWTFDNAGTLTVAGNIAFPAFGPYPNPTIGTDANANISIVTPNNIVLAPDFGGNNFVFGANGNLTIPNGIIGNGNLYVYPDANNTGGRLDIFLTYGPDVHIAAVDENLILGRDESANVTVGANGQVYIQAKNGTPYTWTFGSDSNLTVPGNIQSYYTGFSFRSTVVNISTGSPTVVVTLVDSPFPDPVTGLVTISGVTGTTEANGTWGFQAVEVNQFQLYTDATLSTPVDGTTWTSYISGGQAVSTGYQDLNLIGGNINITSGNSTASAYGNITLSTGGYNWTYGNDGELYLPSGGRLGFAGKGWTGLDGGNGSPVSITSFYANGYYAGCITNNNDGNIIVSTYTGGGLQGSWTFDNGANLVLAPTNLDAGGAGSGESAKLRGTRKIVNGYTNTYPYSTVLAAGGTPTVAYTATDNSVMSAKITFAVEGANGVWEQFDVSAVIDNTGNNVNFTVSNRVKRNNAIPDTVVTAGLDGSDRITISLNLDTSQTGGGWSSFDAVEFGLMVG